MATLTGPILLNPTGSTGTPTSAAFPIGAEADVVSIEFIVEAIGATPTITYKAQVSDDGGANWIDAPYVTAASDAITQAAITRTTVGVDPIWLDRDSDVRKFTHVRTVVTANTNVTFRSELRIWDDV